MRHFEEIKWTYDYTIPPKDRNPITLRNTAGGSFGSLGFRKEVEELITNERRAARSFSIRYAYLRASDTQYWYAGPI